MSAPRHPADAQAVTLPPAEGRPARFAVECLRCLRDDPDRAVGFLAAHPDRDEARRLMRNHIAQRHD